MKSMRLFTILLLFLSISCSSDDANIVDTENLNGIWNLQSFENDITTTINFSGVPISSQTDARAEDIEVQITFSENPNMVISEGSYTLVVTTTVLGETDTQSFAANDDILSGGWTLNGNEITINNTEPDIEPEFQNITYRIIELSESRLQMRANFTVMQTIEGNDAEFKIKSNIIMTR